MNRGLMDLFFDGFYYCCCCEFRICGTATVGCRTANAMRVESRTPIKLTACLQRLVTGGGSFAEIPRGIDKSKYLWYTPSLKNLKQKTLESLSKIRRFQGFLCFFSKQFGQYLTRIRKKWRNKRIDIMYYVYALR